MNYNKKNTNNKTRRWSWEARAYTTLNTIKRRWSWEAGAYTTLDTQGTYLSYFSAKSNVGQTMSYFQHRTTYKLFFQLLTYFLSYFVILLSYFVLLLNMEDL